jgi:hypothetical protein
MSDFSSEQRLFIKNFYNEDVCSWILNETIEYSKTHGWKTNRHDSYPTTDIEISNIPHVFKFILNSFYTRINKLIKNYYNLNYDLHIFDGFIVKYEYNKQNFLDKHKDGSIITFSLLLNSNKSFLGGGIKFIKDNIEIHSNIGDIIIHPGSDEHCALPIRNGDRFVLVCFLKKT